MDFKKSDLPCADMAVWAVSLNVFWGWISLRRGAAAFEARFAPRAGVAREEKGAGPEPEAGTNDDPFDRSDPEAPLSAAGATAGALRGAAGATAGAAA